MELTAIGVSLATAAAFVSFFFVLEYLWPAEPRQGIKGIWFNAKSAAISQTMLAVCGPAAAILPAWLGRQLGTGYIDLGLGSPQTWPQAALALLVWMLLYDFLYYWWHRIQHAHWIFWAAHRLHHSEEAFNSSTATRGHWVESFYSPFIASLPVTILFAPIGNSSLPIISFIVLSAFGYINHANLNISFGPFLSSPLWHRLHHSSLPEHEGKNLAGYFPFYDMIFGTYVAAPRGKLYPTGLYDGERDSTVLAAHAHPFRVWISSLRRIVRFKRAASP
jgi:sterol desaturase/sphingolipid hydroxylase (fatty acid hydroxylase superfamily)